MNRRTAIGIVLLAAMLPAGCDQVSDFLSDDPEELLVLTVNPTSIPADGSSTANVRADIPAGTPAEDRWITFTTSAGSFLDPNGGTTGTLVIQADSSGRAVAQLRSSLLVESAEVRANTEASGDRGRVHFVVAAPVRIDVTSDRVALDVSLADTATITATLRTNGGLATKGTPVEFFATGTGGGAVGGFAGVTASDSSGQATAEYDPAGTSYRGTVTIRARTQDPGSGAFTEGSTTVEIVD